MPGQFEIYKDVGGQYRFRLKSRNGEIVATGESYPTKAAAKKGVQAVQRAADGAKVVGPRRRVRLRPACINDDRPVHARHQMIYPRTG
jgi:uncharacterized protein